MYQVNYIHRGHHYTSGQLFDQYGNNGSTSSGKLDAYHLLMRVVIATLTLSLLASTYACSQQPNILLILADDLGYGDVGCYNDNCRVATPNVDKLAEQGMRFTDAHSPSTVCTPTRYSILTGRMAFRLNYRGVFTGAGGPCLIEEQRLTLPGMLREQGYKTAMCGKWHIGLTFFDKDGAKIHKNGLPAVQKIDYSRPIPDGPIHRGFDHFFGTACCPTTDWLYAYIDGDRIPNPPLIQLDKSSLPKHAWANDCRRGMIAEDFDLEEVDMVFLDKSLEFLDEHHRQTPTQPFFLFHSLQAVHLPSFASKRFQGTSGAGPHGDFLVSFDHVVGELLRKLDELGIAENTLVILTSDNGPEVSSVINMRRQHQHDGARPWRGMKRDNWEGGHRIPLIARWPNKIEANSTTDQTACLTDIMATCAAITSAELPANAAEDSFNMLPVLQSKQQQPVREFTLHQTISLALAIRQGDWKYLDHKGSGGNNYKRSKALAPFALPEDLPNAKGQLYNLRTDPGETTNLSRQHPDVVAELQAKLATTKSSGRSAPLPQQALPTARFDWPTPGRVIITDTTTMKGRTATSRYMLRILRHEDGQSFRIRHEDYEFLEVEGQDATSERMQKMLGSATAMASAIPDYRITGKGEYAETLDVDEMLDRIMPILSKQLGESPEQAKQISQQFQQPEFREMMQNTLSKYWNSWVGAWTGWQTPASQSTEEKSIIKAFGLSLPAKLTTSHHGAVSEMPGYVRLSLNTAADGPKTRDAIQKLFRETPAAADEKANPPQIAEARFIRHLEVITQLESLRPAWAKLEIVSRVRIQGEERAREQVERHEYTFDWQK